MSVQVAKPLVLLLIPLIIGLLIFSARYLHVRNKAAKIKQIIIRTVVAILLVLSLAGISFMQTGKMVATIFVLDVSDSVNDHEDDIIRIVNEAVAVKEKDDYVGIVAFGSEAAVENFVSETVVLSEIQSDIKTSATDLETAVNTALSLMPEEAAKRIVLITDGVENVGSIKNTIPSVVSQKCEVKVMKLEANSGQEAYVSKITVPESAGTGEYFNINVDIESNFSTTATVRLYLGHTLKAQQSVKLQKGHNTFVFRDSQSEEGMKNYRAIIEAEGDTLSVNNEYSAYTNISVKRPVMVIEGQQGEGTQFAKLLDSVGVMYTMIPPDMAPGTLGDMLEYSAIILLDTYANDLKSGFIDNLEAYVRDYGGGFAACGGRSSFGIGDYENTAIETVLPVKMDFQRANELPVAAVQIIVDQSGSMMGDSLEYARTAAKEAVRNLRSHNYVGIMGFASEYVEIVPLQKVTDRAEMEKAIDTVMANGGTRMYSALVPATEKLAACDAESKHIIILSDGQDAEPDSVYRAWAEAVKALNITVSTVGIGGCNESLLRMIAETTGGRFYKIENHEIPRIFVEEIEITANGYMVNEEFTPIITANDELINQVSANGLPSILGYIATEKKARATELFRTHMGDPLLSYWQYGLGRTVAWTSDVTGEWSANWSGWNNNALLWHNLIQFITEDTSVGSAYAEVEQEGTKAVVKYYTEDFNARTEVNATVSDVEGNQHIIELIPVAPGEYEAQFEMTDTGIYSVGIKQTENGELVNSAVTAGIMQYSPEYRFEAPGTLLEEYVAAVNGKMITGPNEIFEDSLEFVKGMKDISTALMVAAILIFIIDIANRRFRFNFMGRIKDKVVAERAARLEKAEKTERVVTKSGVENSNTESGITETGIKETKKKPDKPAKKNKKEIEKTVPERLDTSQLLGRMKK